MGEDVEKDHRAEGVAKQGHLANGHMIKGTPGKRAHDPRERQQHAQRRTAKDAENARMEGHQADGQQGRFGRCMHEEHGQRNDGGTAVTVRQKSEETAAMVKRSAEE